MILIVYVAVSLTVIGAAFDSPEETRVNDVIGASFLLPFLLSGLSALFLPPGPSRDWVVVSFWTIFHGLFAVLMILPSLIVVFMYRGPRGPIGPVLGVLFVVAISLFWGLFILGFAISLGRRQLIPTQCPRCGKKRLLRAALPGMACVRPFFHVRCGICDRIDCLELSQIKQGCPVCHRRTWIFIRYTFYWCLDCRSRYKRLRHGEWEEASSSLEDGIFWLWSSGGSLRTLIDRITKTAR